VTSQTIIIIGFMGSGKTTVANELARLLDCRAIDLDSWIAEREQRCPAEIIEQESEAAFREIETRALNEVLRAAPGGSATIIAVGGGAWTIAENRQLIAERNAFTVWLDPSFELCWQRITAGPEVRPLARGRAQAQALYVARRPVYETADARIAVAEDESVAEIAKRIANALAE
jgi:shikimate kinase